MTDVLHQIEEIGALEMSGKPLGNRVELLLKNYEQPADVQAILNALPPSVARLYFLPILENKDTKNRAEIAKAYIPVINSVQFPDPRKAYQVLNEVLSTNEAYKVEAHAMLVKYLQTFSQVGDIPSDGVVEKKAREAIVNCLRLDGWNFDEVVDLMPVRTLAASTNQESKACHQLLQAFTAANYHQFAKASQQYADQIQKLGLDVTALTEKIRLLALCKLAHDTIDGPVSFKDIASALGVPEDQVENYVVEAIGKKLLAAKIDQVAKRITVSYAHLPVFVVDQWRQLQETLERWQQQLQRLSA
jgi:translation initiation factor 3 subunit M